MSSVEANPPSYTHAAGAGQADTTHRPRRAAQLACVLEVSAEKPGNITPSHDFDDTSYEDMLRSGIALGA